MRSPVLEILTRPLDQRISRKLPATVSVKFDVVSGGGEARYEYLTPLVMWTTGSPVHFIGINCKNRNMYKLFIYFDF